MYGIYQILSLYDKLYTFMYFYLSFLDITHNINFQLALENNTDGLLQQSNNFVDTHYRINHFLQISVCGLISLSQ